MSGDGDDPGGDATSPVISAGDHLLLGWAVYRRPVLAQERASYRIAWTATASRASTAREIRARQILSLDRHLESSG